MLTFNPQDPFSCFVTQSLSMKSAVENAQRFAMFDVPLLIQGETGTGKDLLAKACHFASLRREKKFIAVNCAGLPDEDAESEMFGRKILRLALLQLQILHRQQGQQVFYLRCF